MLGPGEIETVVSPEWRLTPEILGVIYVAAPAMINYFEPEYPLRTY